MEIHPPHLPLISCREFGLLADGRAVQAWTLRGRGGLELEILTYGGIVRSLLVPHGEGRRADVVWGFDGLAEYERGAAFVGATVGRIAGRIGGGRLRIGGREFSLPCNEGTNHLHGGGVFNKRLWQAVPGRESAELPSLCLTLHSEEGEQGYPGAITVRAIYTVTDDNAFLFETEVEASAPTPVSLTHHGYFNLGGGENILSHVMQIFAEHFVPTGENMVPSGRLVPVEGTPADLRTPALLAEVVPRLPGEHGELYWLGESGTTREVARVHSSATGLCLAVTTDHSCLQTYFAKGFDGSIPGKGGRALGRFGAFCLECQGYPQGDEFPQLGHNLVLPGRPQRRRTRYQFTHHP